MIRGVVASTGRSPLSTPALPTPAWENVVSLIGFDSPDNSFSDETGLLWTSADGAKIDGGDSRFGSKSGLFDGSYDQISADVSGRGLGLGEFTIEGHVLFLDNEMPEYFMATSPTPYLWLNRNVAGVGRLGAYLFGSSVNSDPIIEPSRWYHVAIVGYSSSVSLFVGGVLQSTRPRPAPTEIQTLMYGGASGLANPTRFGSCRLSEWRACNEALYSEDFAPPESPFPRSR